MSLKNKVTKFVLLAVVICLVVVGAGLLTFSFMLSKSTNIEESNENNSIPIAKESQLDDKLNILLLGSDSKYKGHTRADTIMVASIDLTEQKVGIISIPRDTRVKLADRNSYNKINAAYSYDGVELTQRSIENLLQIEIDHYLEVDYQGFIDMVNTLGGIELEIEKDLHYVDQADNLYIDLKAGKTKLSGEDALSYVRFRHDALGDLGRIQRQQKFLKAALDKILDVKTLFKVPELVKDFSQNVKTNLGLSKMLKLASFIPNFSLEEIEMAMLPGEPKYIDGVSYWLPHKEETRVLVNTLIRDKSYLNHKELQLVILNGNGQQGVANDFADLLEQQGYSIKRIGNADRFDYSQTTIVAPQNQLANLEDLSNYLKSQLVVGEESEIKIIIGQDIDHIRAKQGIVS
ncbi:LytR family transcriptional attenuator [Orenia metallireducens]|uniref:Transcriptional attenuator, LytR family n=1 Tax=Orenia metallireducens TaxID=1413210 RepID=A0A285IDK3_9FIRM|nr:LCP family protein [Orenia metallireducens]PRX20612.1 LytR family transcriptional attenuator [Orenia metallireducens]SNY45156.1 transcriptional attenuator, LytR family [Orenia metallireducens]